MHQQTAMEIMMDPISKAANAIRASSAIVIATGAGMGVDSGLPDFRGDEGFCAKLCPMLVIKSSSNGLNRSRTVASRILATSIAILSWRVLPPIG